MTLIERLINSIAAGSAEQVKEARAALQSAIQALQAENERLKEKLESWKDECHRVQALFEKETLRASELHESRDALAAKLATLEADAARYRWLREQHDEDEGMTLWHVRGSIGAPILNGMLDAAIDAAKGGQQ